MSDNTPIYGMRVFPNIHKFDPLLFIHKAAFCGDVTLASRASKKCLYSGKSVLVLPVFLCSLSLILRGLEICPILYWLLLVHLVHSSR